MTGFREKPALSFDSQPFLYPVDGELCPGERGPQFIFSPQLGSCGHVVEGVSRSGGHIVLRNWNQQRETGCPPGPGGRCDFIPCLSGRHNGPYFNYSYEPLVNPNSAEPLSGSEPLSPGSARCLPGAQLRASGILTLPGIIWARFHTSPPEKAPPHVRLYGYRPRPQSGWIPGSLGSLAQAGILPTARGTYLTVGATCTSFIYTIKL